MLTVNTKYYTRLLMKWGNIYQGLIKLAWNNFQVGMCADRLTFKGPLHCFAYSMMDFVGLTPISHMTLSDSFKTSQKPKVLYPVLY